MNRVAFTISGRHFWAFALNEISEEGGDHTVVSGRIWNEEPVISVAVATASWSNNTRMAVWIA